MKITRNYILHQSYRLGLYYDIFKTIGFMHSCTTSWTSASSLFPVCHYWPNL